MTKQRIPKLSKKGRRPAANSLAAALRWDTIAAQGAEHDQAAGDQAGSAGAQGAAQPAQGAEDAARPAQGAEDAATAGAQTTPSPTTEHTPC